MDRNSLLILYEKIKILASGIPYNASRRAPMAVNLGRVTKLFYPSEGPFPAAYLSNFSESIH